MVVSGQTPAGAQFGVDDMHCAVCNQEVYLTNIPSLSLVEWVPEGEGGGHNVLIATLCVKPQCLRYWVEKRAAA